MSINRTSLSIKNTFIITKIQSVNKNKSIWHILVKDQTLSDGIAQWEPFT